MQGDKKIGLAMSLLLIGAVAAFFFRDEEFYPRTAPPLADPEALDRQIAAVTDPLYPPQPELNEHRPFSQKLLEAPEWSQRPAEPPLEPIPFSSPGVPVPDSVFEQSPTSGLPGDPTGQFKIYTVQTGDTLSGIAYELLGRSSRFNEIFTANQDQLRTPDDLRVGMRIRIPAAGNTPARPATPPATPRPKVPQVTQAPVDPREAEPFVRNPEPPAGQPQPQQSQPPIPQQPQTPAELGFHVRRPRPAQPRPVVPGTPPTPGVPSYQADPLSPGRPPHSAQPTPAQPVPALNQPLKTFDHEGAGTVPFESGQPTVRNSTLRQSEPGGRRETPELPPVPRQYQVRSGDTLESIAIQYYGSPQAVRKIFQENRPLLQQPGPLRVGSTLRLPPQ